MGVTKRTILHCYARAVKVMKRTSSKDYIRNRQAEMDLLPKDIFAWLHDTKSLVSSKQLFGSIKDVISAPDLALMRGRSMTPKSAGRPRTGSARSRTGSAGKRLRKSLSEPVVGTPVALLTATPRERTVSKDGRGRKRTMSTDS